MPRVMNTSRLVRSWSGHAASSTGGCARCCATCTTTGPRQPTTFSKPLTRRRSPPRNAMSVSMPRANASQGSGASSVITKLEMPSVCSASAMKPGAAFGKRIEMALDRAVNGGVRIEGPKARLQSLHQLRFGDIGFRHDQPVREDDLPSALRRPSQRVEAAHGLDDSDHCLDVKFAA